MKKFLFLLTALSVVMSMWAAPVDKATATQKAKMYLANEMYAGKIMAPDALNPVLIKTEYGTGRDNSPVYYIFNTASTYLVMSADDRAEEILMEGDAPLDLNNIPCGLECLLNIYREQLSYLIDRPTLQVEKPERRTASRAVYGPLLSANWDQSAPYNNLCNFTYQGTTYTCLTGCPATSASMVLYYWKYPVNQIPAIPAYTSTLDISSTRTVTFTYPALDATTFDWANMKDNYSSSTANNAANNAVATLMRHVGQAEHMMYGTSAAGGSGIYTSNANIIATMFKNWGYDSNCRRVYKSSYSETNWATLIQNEMAAGHPIVYMAVDPSDNGGHAFNVDGYRDSDGKYHVNFGWSGSGNNWYAMNAFGNYYVGNFTSDQQAIVGIMPPGGSTTAPNLTVNTTSLTFSTEVGTPVTQTFTVTGSNLNENVVITAAGSSNFSVSPATITPSQAANGATVTVTYDPAAAGTHSSTLSISSAGTQSKTITLSGTATGAAPTGPTLNANPSTLTLSTEVGTPVTQTFVVTGSNLTASVVTLSCSGEGFSINKTQISRTAVQSASGSTVTVTYNPTSSGTHTGTVTISSTGAESKTVTLNGTATAAPMLTVDPTSLSFNTEVGTSATQTFTVTGTDLTGGVSLAVSGAGFTIDKTSISGIQATNGSVVTVTYTPTTGGTHTGTVTLTSPGAATKTVTLTGTANTTPSLTASPSSLTMSTVVGTPVSKTFIVTGTNLTGNVTMVTNGGSFSIDKNSLTVNQATGGATVTVTYNPAAAGTHTGSVIIASSGAQTITVSLSGSATEPVRTITADPTALNFTALVGETVTKTFTVTGENLTGPLSVNVNNGNGIYSVQPSTITVAEATAGKTVTVTYAPTAFGITNASVTISGGGAPAATVTLAGQADLVKYAPVMLPAIEDYIGLTKFRADWTDETPAANVTSYTLEVTPKAVEPEPEPELLGSINGASYPNQNYQVVTLQAPWSGNNVYGGYGAIYFRNATHQSATTDGYIRFTIPAGYQDKAFTVKLTTASGQYGSGRFVVGSTQTTAVEYNMSATETHSWLVMGSTGEVITITSPEDQYSPDIALIEVYSGDATNMLTATESRDGDYRLIEGITDKFYTVEDLTAEGTFLYRVKALYLDGTESEWSNVEEVTLFDNTPAFVRGDVNGVGGVDMDDLSALINYLLDSTSPINTPGAASCTDAEDTTVVDMDDLTALINFLLTGEWE